MVIDMKRCQALAKKFPKLHVQDYICKIDGKWETFYTYHKDQNGYKMATERIPHPSVEELLKLTGSITLDTKGYGLFKKNEWEFLADNLLAAKGVA